MTPTTAHPVTCGLGAPVARFSFDRYQRLIEAGILTPDDRVELLEKHVAAGRFGYAVRFLPVGPQDASLGPPTQMGVFERAGGEPTG